MGRTFYFRFEIGHGFGDIPDHFFVSNDSGENTYEDMPDIPSLSTSGIPVNIFGVGLALF
ncbi:hypothetical protein SAMN03097699_3221 [Flavobacteriaceae bacterium MAR_2010_188]|nr:hypothetical protein SAMN03097699_3221 [Flavobacteriaceae bacterium MAR_2010_188]